MKKIVISGATGSIGVSLIQQAIKRNINVLCLVRNDTKRMENIPTSNLVKITFCSADEYQRLNDSDIYDSFYHLAWEGTFGTERENVELQQRNIKNTLDAVYLAKRLGCKKFIGVGSQSEYGVQSVPLNSKTPISPQSAYGIAKYSAGMLSKILCTQLDLEFNWVRVLSVYGLMDAPNSLIKYTINELLENRSPEFTKSEQIWDYLYCDDAADALLAIGIKGINGKTYTLGSGQGKKLFDFIKIIKACIPTNINLNFGKRDYYLNQPMFLVADITELINDTGWNPSTSFEEGINKIIKTIRCKN